MLNHGMGTAQHGGRSNVKWLTLYHQRRSRHNEYNYRLLYHLFSRDKPLKWAVVGLLRLRLRRYITANAAVGLDRPRQVIRLLGGITREVQVRNLPVVDGVERLHAGQDMVIHVAVVVHTCRSQPETKTARCGVKVRTRVRVSSARQSKGTMLICSWATWVRSKRVTRCLPPSYAHVPHSGHPAC